MSRLTLGAVRRALRLAPPAALLAATSLAALPASAHAQFSTTLGRNRTTPRRDSRTRRENNANRRARIAREIDETYAHRYEFSVGAAYLRFRSGQFLRRNNEGGFYTSLNYYLNPKLSVLGDVHGLFGSAQIGNTIYDIPNPHISQYTFSAGPSYRFYRGQHIAASAFGTGGLGLGNFAGGTKGIFPDRLGLWSTTTRPVATAGVNLDVNFYPNLAVRFTPTWIGTFFDGAPAPDGSQTVHGSMQQNVGVNIGIVYRFGHQ